MIKLKIYHMNAFYEIQFSRCSYKEGNRTLLLSTHSPFISSSI